MYYMYTELYFNLLSNEDTETMVSLDVNRMKTGVNWYDIYIG